MIAVVDYSAGNLTSVETALRFLGAEYIITQDPDCIMKSDKVIFPGVGEARQAMDVLESSGISDALKEFITSGKPLLGICMGCQILQDFSEERETPLLGIVPGTVKLFPGGESIKVPHIGWNTVEHNNALLFAGLPQKSAFYFVHSYYLSTKLATGTASPWVCGIAEHGIAFAAAIHKDNVWGTQFHPEKSGPKGLQLLSNFIERMR